VKRFYRIDKRVKCDVRAKIVEILKIIFSTKLLNWFINVYWLDV
jgi:hypothetical protein